MEATKRNDMKRLTKCPRVPTPKRDGMPAGNSAEAACLSINGVSKLLRMNKESVYVLFRSGNQEMTECAQK